ncbi:MAG: chemotaxis protein CheW [Eubacterium sp.]|nr:chemotaxis protein CheW [Eubacterium sp.]
MSEVTDYRIISLNLGREYYGIDLFDIISIIRYNGITPVPLTNRIFLGVINVRGLIIPVVSLRRFLGFPDVPFDEETRIVIVQDEDKQQLAFLADRVNDVVAVEDDKYSDEVSDTIENRQFIKGILKTDTDLISILNLSAVFEYIGSIKEQNRYV